MRLTRYKINNIFNIIKIFILYIVEILNLDKKFNIIIKFDSYKFYDPDEYFIYIILGSINHKYITILLKYNKSEIYEYNIYFYNKRIKCLYIDINPDIIHFIMEMKYINIVYNIEDMLKRICNKIDIYSLEIYTSFHKSGNINNDITIYTLYDRGIIYSNINTSLNNIYLNNLEILYLYFF